jgi:hypothetical protein
MHSHADQRLPAYLPEGICRVCEVIPAEEFVFCVNGETYSVSLAEAVFLSPRIFSLLKSDITIRFFEITDAHIEQNQLESLLEIVRGRRVKVSGSSRLSLGRLSSQLWNRDLTHLFCGLGEEETIIEPHWVSSVSFDLTVQNRESVLVLGVEELEEILGSEELRIESEDWLLDLIFELGTDYRVLLHYVKSDFLSSEGLSKFLDELNYEELNGEIWCCLLRRLRGERPTGQNPNRYLETGFCSHIITEFPDVLSVLEEKKARLLYRGTRDGFAGSHCHTRVVGHSNLLIIVETTEGCIFGGYAHCKWPEQGWVGDPSEKSFLFTHTNPHNIGARRFGMKSDGKSDRVLHHYADHRHLVYMGNGGAIVLKPGCNGNWESQTGAFNDTVNNRGLTFENDSGRNGLFTASDNYRVKEVEIFAFLD